MRWIHRGVAFTRCNAASVIDSAAVESVFPLLMRLRITAFGDQTGA
jgi:hypothetical protein